VVYSLDPVSFEINYKQIMKSGWKSNCPLHWWWRQHVSPKWWLPTELNGVPFQSISISMVTTSCKSV
jgi:hypothetical protein